MGMGSRNTAISVVILPAALIYHSKGTGIHLGFRDLSQKPATGLQMKIPTRT